MEINSNTRPRESLSPGSSRKKITHSVEIVYSEDACEGEVVPNCRDCTEMFNSSI